MTEAHIEVAVVLPLHSTFTYHVPDHLRLGLHIGSRLLVPFGRRRVSGFVLGAASADPAMGIRDVISVLDDIPLFPESMVPLFRWAASYYLYPIGEVIKTALPGGIGVSETTLYTLLDAGRDALAQGQGAPPDQAILNALKSRPLNRRQISSACAAQVRRDRMHAMVARGWVTAEQGRCGDRVRTKRIAMVGLPAAATAFSPLTLSAKRRQVVQTLSELETVSIPDLCRAAGTTASLIRQMIAAGQLTLMETAVYRDPFGDAVTPDEDLELNGEQQVALDTVAERLNAGFHPFLLAGVTGSGKTEIYLQLARRMLDAGRSVVVLVPEIALISQMERRFRARLAERIAVLHSGLSDGERYDQWMMIRRAPATVVVGARSAIWAPVANLGLIIVDEEHDGSYKQDGGLRYNGRDLAVVRARQTGCPVILGSATPSVQSVHNAATGKYTELRLTRRVAERPLPEIRIVDLKTIRDERGIRRHLSEPLRTAIRETLDRGQQSLLFLNRRGYATYPVCSACGTAIRCRHCDITLTLHRGAGRYRCHYCGFSLPAAAPCSQCGSDRMLGLGLGTEKLQEAVAALYPDARVERMDRDTTARKGSLLKMLRQLRRGDIDILIGTQMVAKGHDFPNITLVGIVCADVTLSVPDFRAGERTFQLLAQVAGRTGRGDVPGRVVLQTFNPDHFTITAARTQDFRVFYREEIEHRKMLAYPPFTRLVLLEISGTIPEQTAETSERMGRALRAMVTGSSQFSQLAVLGPVEASLARIAGRHRWHILLKGRHAGTLNRLMRTMMSENANLFQDSKVRVVTDMDPMAMA
ncbi:MAG: primosomal protein N' [Pseudomonadota bacterium]